MLIFHDYPVHGAIFDMDGTMFDTERLRFQTLKQASQELIGQEFSDDYLMQCLGLSAKTAEQLAQKIYGTEVPYQTIRKRADELELEFVRNQGVPIKKGLVQVLERLRKSGLRMAVATSSRRAIAEEYLIFRTSKSDHIEIVATLFACWLRLLENKQSVTEEQLLKDFYAWSEEKNRFSKAEVLNGYKWMKMYSITPIK